jgi:hypothetical protein
MRNTMRTKRTKMRAGISLVEIVIATMLVSMILVGAMNCVGATIRGRLQTADSIQAKRLVDQLMAEILALDYRESVDPPVFGRESTEDSFARTDWDDVDDYHLWTASPPENRSGTALANSTDWQRDVLVEWVDPADPANTVGTDQGVKRITVTVRRNGEVHAQDFALRSEDYPGN